MQNTLLKTMRPTASEPVTLILIPPWAKNTKSPIVKIISLSKGRCLLAEIHCHKLLPEKCSVTAY